LVWRVNFRGNVVCGMSGRLAGARLFGARLAGARLFVPLDANPEFSLVMAMQ